MKIESFIWYRDIVDKLIWKHNVSHEEVEEVFRNKPKFKMLEKGKIKNENLYSARGKTNAGRYLKEALIVTARDMDSKERKSYAKK
jgi:uncharacterized DUF497 family protein